MMKISPKFIKKQIFQILIPVFFENSSKISSLDLLLGMLPTNNLWLATEMLTFKRFPDLIS